MVYVAVIVIWLTSGQHFAAARSFDTEAACQAALVEIQNSTIHEDAVASGRFACLPVSNAATERSADGT